MRLSITLLAVFATAAVLACSSENPTPIADTSPTPAAGYITHTGTVDSIPRSDGNFHPTHRLLYPYHQTDADT